MPTRTDMNGVQHFSWLDTYVFWRNLTTNFLSIKEQIGKQFPTKSEFIAHNSLDGKGLVCKYCNSMGMGEISDDGQMGYCICLLMEKIKDIEHATAGLRSFVDPDSMLMKMELWGTGNPTQASAQKQSLETAIKLAKRFVREPKDWLLLMGVPGCGKTHILEAVANLYGPFALFMTGADFEDIVFSALQDGTINEVMHSIRTAPILLFDDWGTEHGKDFVRSSFRKIVTYRYARWPEFPIMATSNNNITDLRILDSRVESRFSDKEKSLSYFMKVPDYRSLKAVRHA